VLGMACALSTFGIMERRFVLGAAALTFGGVIVGRLFGLVLDRGFAGYGPTVRNLFLVDATGCALAVAALVLEA
jgi:hypothetical protein